MAAAPPTLSHFLAATLGKLSCPDTPHSIEEDSFRKLLVFLKADADEWLASIPARIRLPNDRLCIQALTDYLVAQEQWRKWKKEAQAEASEAATEAACAEGDPASAAPLPPQADGPGAAERGAAPEAAEQAASAVHKEEGDGGHARAWAFHEWLRSLDFEGPLAERVRAHVCGEGRRDDFVLAFIWQMHEHGSKAALKKLLLDCGALDVLTDCLWRGGEGLHDSTAATGQELNAKFAEQEGNFEMSYSTMEDFFGGLEKLIGAPDPKLLKAMKEEHCDSQDSNVEFTTKNYKITTTPSTEWLFATGGDPPDAGRWPEEKSCKEGHRRTAQSFDWLKQRMHAQNALLRHYSELLIEEEAIALRLYTGPMYQKYNTVLRALAHKNKFDSARQRKEELEKKACSTAMTAKDKREHMKLSVTCEKLEEGMVPDFLEAVQFNNRYTTTIHVINSGLVKLSRIQKAEKVYRGVTKGLLPKEFWQPNDWGVCGGVENGFLSTTVSREVATTYASCEQGAAGTVFEIQMSMVDRGANLQWVSQYPHEEELCFAPLTGLQVISTRVEKTVLVVEARLNINLVSLTINEVIAKRKKMVAEFCDQLCDEVKDAVTKLSGDWRRVWESPFKMDAALWGTTVQHLYDCMRSSMAASIIDTVHPEDMNDNEKFVEAIMGAVDIKLRFEKPTVTSVLSFLASWAKGHAGADIWQYLQSLLSLDERWKLLVERSALVKLADFRGSAELTDVVVKYLSEGCHNLQEVNFAMCKNLTDNAARYLADDCPNLQRLNLEGCSGITDVGLMYLVTSCRNLQPMDLAKRTDMTKEAMDRFAEQCAEPFNLQVNRGRSIALMLVVRHCPSLRLLELSGTFAGQGIVTDSAVRDLAENSRGLHHVDFTGCTHLTDDAVKHLAEKCSGLHHANFAGCQGLTDLAAEYLSAGCQEIQHASFSECAALSDNAATCFAGRCPKLQQLNFDGCGGVTDRGLVELVSRSTNLLPIGLMEREEMAREGMEALAEECAGPFHLPVHRGRTIALMLLARHCPKLRVVDLSGSFAKQDIVADDTVRDIAEKCRSLQHADFAGCKQLTDLAVQCLARECKNLRHISFRECSKLTDAALKSLAGGCPDLQHVDFAGCRLLTDAGVKHVAEACNNLQHASFTCCSRLTDDAAMYLAEGCTGLQCARFGECRNLTNAAAKHLADWCPDLQAVNLEGCSLVTDEGLRDLATKCKKLQPEGLESYADLTKEAMELLAQTCARPFNLPPRRGRAVALMLVARHCRELRLLDLSGSFADFVFPVRRSKSVALKFVSRHITGANLSDLSAGYSSQEIVTDDVVEQLAGTCKGLEHANFNGCAQLTDAAAKYLAEGCKVLQHVSFSDCDQMTDLAAAYLSKGCPHLRHVDFTGCALLTDDAIKCLAEACQNLQYAIFSNCTNLTDLSAQYLAQGCRDLRHASFSECTNFSDHAAMSLAGGCPNLEWLNLEGCTNVTDQGLEDLARRTNLQPKHMHDDVTEMKCDDDVTEMKCEHMEKLAARCAGPFNLPAHRGRGIALMLLARRCPNLRLLDLSGNFAAAGIVTDDAVRHLAESCRMLQHADFSNCQQLTDGAVQHLAQTCSHLEHAAFGNCGNITDVAASYLAGGCKELRHADFSGCTNLTDNAVRDLAEACKGLQHASFAGCANLTDLSATCLAGGCRGLQCASFRGCPKLTDEAARCLAEGCPDLEHLNLDGCDGVTDAGLKFLVRKCTKLRPVGLFDRADITKEVMDALAQQCAEPFNLPVNRGRTVALMLLTQLCPNIRKLEIPGSFAAMTDDTVQCLAESCRSLWHVDFAGCTELTDTAVKYLAGCKDLHHVDFSGCTALTDTGVGHLAEACKSLQHALFTGCSNLTDLSAGSLSEGCKGLRIASFGGCHKLTDHAAECLANCCPNLERVNLEDCPGITDEGLKCLVTKCRNLQPADLERCIDMTKDAMEALAARCVERFHLPSRHGWSIATMLLSRHCPGLFRLDLSTFAGDGAVTDESVKDLAEGCKSLQHVDFTGCAQLTDLAAEYLADGCGDLLHVTLAGCVGLTDSAVRSLAERCKGLLRADFAGCGRLTDSAAQYLAQSRRSEHAKTEPVKLQHVNFSDCLGLTDNAAKHLAHGCAHLLSVDFSRCGDLTNSTAKYLADGCKQLQVARLAGCRHLTDMAVKYLTEGCHDLQVVDFTGCEKLTDNAAKYLAENCKGLAHANFTNCVSLTDHAAKYLAAECQKLQFVGFFGCWGVTEDAKKALEDVKQAVEAGEKFVSVEIMDPEDRKDLRNMLENLRAIEEMYKYVQQSNEVAKEV